MYYILKMINLLDISPGTTSYGDNLIRTCELLDLETRTIVYGGQLRGPDSHLQVITLGASDFLAAFANPGAVAKEDMVIWNPDESRWNQNFPAADSYTTWPARFGAAVVSKDMICPSDDVELE